jgi:hypothetical protein
MKTIVNHKLGSHGYIEKRKLWANECCGYNPSDTQYWYIRCGLVGGPHDVAEDMKPKRDIDCHEAPEA